MPSRTLPESPRRWKLAAQALSAIFTTGFSQTLAIVKPAGNNMIRAEVFTRFTDRSNRSNYTEGCYTFKRQLRLMPMRPAPMPRPALREDCVSFEPATAVSNIDGRWKIVDGSHWLFDFGDKRVEALKIIKYFRMDSSCFVGRPDVSFKYLRK